jgi:hypothetical protein
MLPLPIEPRNRAARTAVHHLSNAQLISEREAVSALEDMGANEDEIDLVLSITAVVRRGALLNCG